MFTDASAQALGAVLVQGRDAADERPLEFASRKLIGAEVRYTVTEKEALAVVWALDKFRGYLTGSPITVFTDHQPLRLLCDQTLASGRLARWALKLMSFQLTIEHLAGKYNNVADYLSRPQVDSKIQLQLYELSNSSVNNEITRTDQLDDPEVRKITIAIGIGGGAASQAEHYRNRGYFVSSGVLHRSTEDETDYCPVVVPEKKRSSIMHDYHGSRASGHFGVERTLAKITARFFWNSMRRDVRAFVLSCPDCQRYKPVSRPPPQIFQARAHATQEPVSPLEEYIKDVN